MTLSLRTRFALLTGLLVFAVASLVALAGYLTMRASLLDRASRTAQGEARQLAALVDAPSSSGGDVQGNRVDITDSTLTHELAAPGALIEVRRPRGSLIQASAPRHSAPPSLPTGFGARCLSAGRAKARLAKPPLALACQRVGSRGAPLGTISVGTPLADVLGSLRTLRTALVLGVLGGAGLAAALALLLARRATRPIGEIAATAETIRSGDLGRRIGYRGRDELGALAGVLDACFSELEHALERQRRFGADASHELRTPIAAIRANVELLRNWAGADPAARDRAIASLEQASSRAARLIEDLLYLATIEHEPPRAHTPVRLEEVIVGVVREANQLRPDVAIEITRLDEATVNGDAHRLQQLLLNVLDNALRVTPPRRTVAVQLTVAGPDATITISDQGPGIEPDKLTRIFDRLYTRPAQPSDERTGSGLGLSIARAIARTHNGELSAHNNPDQGTTFTLTLPVLAGDRHAISA